MSDDEKYYKPVVPRGMQLDEMTEEEHHLLMESETFCMMPWMHMHNYPDGRAYPCCVAHYDHHIGDLNQQSIKEVWNDAPLRKMRQNMLAGVKCKECKTCYHHEGYDNWSMRLNSNKHYGHYIKEVLPATHEDGTADVFKLRYYDIRFSNLCNMKCRTCGDVFSNLWAEEDKKRFNLIGYRGELAEKPSLQHCGRYETDMIDQLLEHIPYVEQIYFAGGEPLIMPEHFALIKELLDREMYHVNIAYNTNFSILEYGRDNSILEDWKRFNLVSVGASLDASDARGEYMRKGTKWDQTVRNRERMIEVCPGVHFHISCTISLFNILHITDFHKDWVEKGFIEPNQWHCNIMETPYDRHVSVLPQHLKDLAREKILGHIDWLNTFEDAEDNKCIPEYGALIRAMDKEDNSHRIPEFYRINDPLDEWREEKFDDVFPELTDMRKYQ